MRRGTARRGPRTPRRGVHTNYLTGSSKDPDAPSQRRLAASGRQRPGGTQRPQRPTQMAPSTVHARPARHCRVRAEAGLAVAAAGGWTSAGPMLWRWVPGYAGLREHAARAAQARFQGGCAQQRQPPNGRVSRVACRGSRSVPTAAVLTAPPRPPHVHLRSDPRFVRSPAGPAPRRGLRWPRSMRRPRRARRRTDGPRVQPCRRAGGELNASSFTPQIAACPGWNGRRPSRC
jgi:hypothetical protein